MDKHWLIFVDQNGTFNAAHDGYIHALHPRGSGKTITFQRKPYPKEADQSHYLDALRFHYGPLQGDKE